MRERESAARYDEDGDSHDSRPSLCGCQAETERGTQKRRRQRPASHKPSATQRYHPPASAIAAPTLRVTITPIGRELRTPTLIPKT